MNQTVLRGPESNKNTVILYIRVLIYTGTDTQHIVVSRFLTCVHIILHTVANIHNVLI